MRDVLAEIVERRRARIGRLGHSMGCPVPERRAVPLVPFLRDPPVICEIKRRSPSRGGIEPELDAADHAARYEAQGVRSVSVLTEEEYFAGSLRDLEDVKKRFPHLAVLRKDFLLDEEDIDVSYRAGADAVLLIAAILDAGRLTALARRAESLGMAALVEIHDRAEAERIAELAPPLVGINSRNLADFSVDPLRPLVVREAVSWACDVVYESGIASGGQAEFAFSAGFRGILVGEAAVRRPALVAELIAAAERPQCAGGFWPRIARRLAEREAGMMPDRPVPPIPLVPLSPLVKICGITRRADAELAAELGADILGFVLADSPRRATAEAIRSCADIPLLKAAVVANPDEGQRTLLRNLAAEGAIDAVQYHDLEYYTAAGSGAAGYHAIRVRDAADIERAAVCGYPRVLLDAYDPVRMGGSGRRIDSSLVRDAADRFPLWLAGGLGPENVAEAVRELRPELIDASSALESAPGEKDPERLRHFFREIGNAANG